jgi:hypothetical protein
VGSRALNACVDMSSRDVVVHLLHAYLDIEMSYMNAFRHTLSNRIACLALRNTTMMAKTRLKIPN